MIHFLAVAFMLFAGLGLSGCASLTGTRTQDRELTLEREWVRSTLTQEFLAFRRTHRMTPIAFGDLIIQGNSIDGIVAYDRKSGNEAWRVAIENGVEGGAQISGDKLYFGASDGQFYCISAENGKTIWTFPVRAETLSPPTVDGGIVYFQSGADLVFSLDAATGKQLWLYNRQTAASLSIRASTRPVVDGNLLYVGFSDGFLVALSRQTGAMQWEKKLTRNLRFKDVDATPVVDGNTIYVSSYDGSLYALNKATGDILWQLDEGGYTPVTLAKDLLYFSTSGGAVHALDKASGRKVWTVNLKRGIGTQPTLMGGYLVFGESEGSLVVADARTGSLLTQFAPGRGILATPLVSERSNEIFFVSANANLFALKLGFRSAAGRLPWHVEGN